MTTSPHSTPRFKNRQPPESWYFHGEIFYTLREAQIVNRDLAAALQRDPS